MAVFLPLVILIALATFDSSVDGRNVRHHSTSDDDVLNEISDEEDNYPSPSHHHRKKILDENNNEDKILALQHVNRVSVAGSCEFPREKTIHVSDHYPGKYYLPHCTLLHRCGKHSGCCGTETLRCVAAKKEEVTLHFFSVKFAKDGSAEQKIEKLVFTNHTKCACSPSDFFTKHDL